MNDSEQPKLYVPMMEGFYDKFSWLGYPLIRFTVGFMLMPHGAQKLFGMFGGSTEGAAKYFAHLGFEPALAITIFVGCIEVFGGAAMALGLFTRFFAAAVTIQMAVIVFVAHWPHGWFWTTGGIEHPLLWGLVTLGVFLIGSGRLSIDRAIGRQF